MDELHITVPKEFKRLFEAKGPIVTVPHQILRQTAAEVTRFGPKLAETVKLMKQIMNSKRGVGLAAPQVGVGKRIVIVYTPWDSSHVLINPRITAMSEDNVDSEEGCLSIPGLYGIVSRPKVVMVRYQDLKGTECTKTFEGLSAVAMQHEIDHLNGILFTDRVNKETLAWRKPRG
jgi:peptide deformylase